MRYVVTFDADGQHRIEDVETMLETMASSGVDVVMGSRFLGQAINMPRSKRAVLKLAILFSNLSTGVKLTDTHNGLRVLNRHALESMRLTMPDFAHASEIVDRIGRERLNYTEVPVTIVYSEYSKAKGQSLINAVNIAFDVILSKVVGL
jgi:polyprenyl-phospho-N-acetylgalactosaminyl synthase